ncbi:MAG: diguanylate cyclase [Bacillota bacterium]|nr:diguanylate cyclase [Bacillota bacterium]
MGSKKNILVVYNKAETLRYIKSMPEEYYDVRLISDGATALQYLDTHIPDLIIIDINMPKMDGFILLEQINKIPSLYGIPIIFLTADLNPESEIRALQLGATDFITKPIRRESLLQRVEMHILHGINNREIASKFEQVKIEAEQARIEAMKDELTGLWKRKYISAAVNQHITVEGKNGTLLMLDIDGFKRVNDIYGHQTGDSLLKTFAFFLQHNLSREIIKSRIGGDEFCLFMPGIIDKEQVEHVAAKILQNAETSFKMREGSAFASVSIGIAIMPMDGSRFEEAFNMADYALQEAKSRGKGTLCFADSLDNANYNYCYDNWTHELLKGRYDETKTIVVKFGELQAIYQFSCILAEKGGPLTHVIVVSADAVPNNKREDVLDTIMQEFVIKLKNIGAVSKNGSSQLIALVFDITPEQIRSNVINAVKQSCPEEIASVIKVHVDC